MKTAEKSTIRLNLPDQVAELIEEYGKKGYTGAGENDDGEEITVSICKDRVSVTTFQKNGWIREAVYYMDGSSEEIFHGRWK